MILSYNNMIFVAVDMKLVLQMFSSERNVSHLMSTRLEIRCHWVKNYKLDFSSKKLPTCSITAQVSSFQCHSFQGKPQKPLRLQYWMTGKRMKWIG